MKRILCYFEMNSQRWYMFTGNLLMPATLEVGKAKLMDYEELMKVVDYLELTPGNYYQKGEGCTQAETGIY